MQVRWAIAIAGIALLAMVAVNFYMPWRQQDSPMPEASTSASPTGGEAMLACPADARPAKLDFQLKDLNGKVVTLADYKGKVLLVDFWATWCEPCKFEIPGFVDLYAKYKSKGFEAVGVVVLDEFVNAKPFAAKLKMNYPVLDGN